LFGLLFGRLYEKWNRNIDKTFRIMAISGASLMMLGLSLMSYNFSYHFNNFFHLGAGGALYLIGINGVGLWLIHKLLPRLNLIGMRNLLRWCSKRVTSLYIIQWTLICWGMGIIGFQTLNTHALLLSLPVTLSSTLLIQYGLDKFTQWGYAIRRLKTQAV
jgi:hypothetical protein